MAVSKVLFEKYDKDKSGELDVDEFQALIYNMGHAVTHDEALLAFKLLDKDGSGTLDIKEFKIWWSNPDRWSIIQVDPETLAIREAAARVFSHFDQDQDGIIGVKEFTPFYEYLVKENLTKKPMDVCRQDLDENLDGNIQFNEYVDWVYRQFNDNIACAGLASNEAVQKQMDDMKVEAKTPAKGSKKGKVGESKQQDPHDLIKKKKKKDCCIQ